MIGDTIGLRKRRPGPRRPVDWVYQERTLVCTLDDRESRRGHAWRVGVIAADTAAADAAFGELKPRKCGAWKKA